MKVMLVNPRGFCAGVNMAVDVVDQLLDLFPDEALCVYHRHVVDRFRERGVTFVEEISEVPDGSIVVFSAHGVSPAIREEARNRGLRAVDATCPLVTKVHAEAIRYARKGYQILLVGHANHQEVIGTLGEAPDAIQVVESPADIPSLHVDDPAKLAYLTQTTLSVDDAEIIISALKRAFPQIKSPPSADICYATTNRQHAVRTLAAGCDLVLVVGSRNSSNSVRLTEISENVGTRARLIDDRSELDASWLDGVERVLVTAGASAPEDLVRDLVRDLVERFGAEVEQHDVQREAVEFGLPGSLKNLMREDGIDPSTRSIRIDTGGDTRRWLEEQGISVRTVDLTVGASN
jgi:4-hydroxy-3-methylbut-2-enyl diphosphate reductase